MEHTVNYMQQMISIENYMTWIILHNIIKKNLQILKHKIKAMLFIGA